MTQPEHRDYLNAYVASSLYDSDFNAKLYQDSLGQLRDLLEFDHYRHYRLPEGFVSQYVNTDDHGRRVSANPPRDAGQYLVHFFGGSTACGIGTEDRFTIASLLSSALNEMSETSAHVRNYGVGGYNNSQELAYLMQSLSTEEIPDLVIFYDFANEALTAERELWLPMRERSRGFLTPNTVAAPMNEHVVSTTPVIVKLAESMVGVLRRLSSYKFLSLIRKRLNDRAIAPSHNSLGSEALQRTGDPLVTTVERCLDNYDRNMRVINAIAKEYGFNTMFIMQPTLFTKSSLSTYEKRTAENPGYTQRRYEEAIYQGARTRFSKYDNFYDLSNIFADEASTIYLDDHHMSEKGNRAIAKALAELISTTLAREVDVR